MSELLPWLSVPISWLRDLVDILLVAFVVYRVLAMMRGTRGGQVLLGLLVIIGAYVASQFFELVTLNWIMTHFVNNLFLILVVLFQNEIRRALAQVGRGPFFGWEDAGTVVQVTNEVAEAVTAMAATRTGALIVIHRRTVLPGVLATGVPLDARVRHELLETIFHKDTPLHDGAVVIEGDRILAARCVLPLAEREEANLPEDVGTRHRAALGMAEETDAVIVVVSEERGRISLAYDGQIFVGVEGGEVLRAELQRILGGVAASPGASGRGFRRWLRRWRRYDGSS